MQLLGPLILQASSTARAHGPMAHGPHRSRVMTRSPSKSTLYASAMSERWARAMDDGCKIKGPSNCNSVQIMPNIIKKQKNARETRAQIHGLITRQRGACLLLHSFATKQQMKQ
jgi:hypothetical protein